MSFTYDTRVRNIAATLDASGYDVCVICPRFAGDLRRATCGGTRVRFFRQPQLRGGAGQLVEYVVSLAAILVLAVSERAAGRAHIVHFCNPPDVLFVVSAVCRALGSRVVFDQHDLNPELFAVKYPRAPRGLRALVARAEQLAVGVAHEVLVTNESARALVVERNPRAKARVTVVRNGTARRHVAAVQPRPRHGDHLLVGYLGNTNEQDGLDVLLAVARELVIGRARRDVRFVVVGDGDAMPTLRTAIAANGLEHVFELRGRLPPGEALRVIASCDVCVQPDPRNPFTSATTMVKTLEYLALGRPVVTFDLPETRVSCGDAAVYAVGDSPRDLAGAIAAVLDDEALRSTLGQSARESFGARLSWERSAPALLGVYRRLVAGRGARASFDGWEERPPVEVLGDMETGQGEQRRGDVHELHDPTLFRPRHPGPRQHEDPLPVVHR